jgi:solute:Na+ symporter, SSS family
MNTLQSADYIVFLIYFLMVSGYGYWIYKKKQAKTDSASRDYFLAEGALTWWAIGTSLISSNISSEQFIAMSGNGFTMGLAIATYEWMAALTLIIVAVYFIPVYLKNKIYTMPQFLHQRYNSDIAMIMAIFWLLLYVIVNLTSILYLGALAINGISGLNLDLCMYLLAIFSIIIALGGMKVIGYTAVIQVVFLIFGGLVTTYLALNKVALLNGQEGVMNGLSYMMDQSGDHFHMIFKNTDAHYMSLPGLSVLIGGMWIVNLNYWGCNQYITQRALGADLKTAREGILFAAFLKLLIPIIVVLPGIAAYVIYTHGGFQTELLGPDGVLNPDKSYPVLLNLLPAGLKGLSFAALTAAVVASLAAKANSISTIFTLDIFKKKIDPEASEKKLVFIGKTTVIASTILAVIIAPHLGIDKKGGFEFIQEYTGFVSPGIFAMFIMGFFWKKTSSNAAMFATIGGFVLSVFFKFLPKMMNLEFLHPLGFSGIVTKEDGTTIYEIPFIDRMGIVFVICVGLMVVISLIDEKRGIKSKGLEIDSSMFKVNSTFLAGALLIIGVLVALYTIFW